MKKIILSLIVLFGIMTPAVAFASANSTSVSQACKGVGVISGSSGCESQSSSAATINSTLKIFINLFSSIIGIIAVVMVMIGGVKYITSNGNSEKASSAKDTIMYAVIGLVVVAIAQIIVAFVLNRVK